MSLEPQIAKMTMAIKQAIKVMGDRFGSTEQDVAKAIEELKSSMQMAPAETVRENAASVKSPVTSK